MGNRLSFVHSMKSDKQSTERRGLKRKLEDDLDSSGRDTPPPSPDISQNSDVLHTPKRKRIQSTSKYIYQTLFLDGRDSDVSVVALGKVWPLHKLYISQSPYFACMFNGQWLESTQDVIEMDIQDPNIDESALKIAFGSLYKDFVIFKPVQSISVLAAATLLQLEGLIQQCEGMIRETISSETVCCYHRAGVTYGLETVRKECFDWLLLNILTTRNVDVLKDISVDLMKKLISTSNLYVMQVETDVYTMLKKWMFLQLHQNWCGASKDLVHDSDEYFKQKLCTLNKNESFLNTEEGRPFLPVFCCIRWQHVISDMSSIKVVEKEKIFSLDWIRPLFERQWKAMIQLEQGLDKGPEETPDVDVFDKHCLRCGRILLKEGECCWRWIGYNFGVDLLISYANRLITIKRNALSCPTSVSLQPGRNIVYRLDVATIDSNGKPKIVTSSGLTHICLDVNEEVSIMTLNNKFIFPLHISFNVLVMTPEDLNVDISQMILQRANKYSKKEHSTQTEQCESHDESGDKTVQCASHDGSHYQTGQCTSHDEVSHEHKEQWDRCTEEGNLSLGSSEFISGNISDSSSATASLPQTVTSYIPP